MAVPALFAAPNCVFQQVYFNGFIDVANVRLPSVFQLSK